MHLNKKPNLFLSKMNNAQIPQRNEQHFLEKCMTCLIAKTKVSLAGSNSQRFNQVQIDIYP